LKIDIAQHIFEKFFNMKSQEDSSNKFQTQTYGKADTHTYASRLTCVYFMQDMEEMRNKVIFSYVILFITYFFISLIPKYRTLFCKIETNLVTNLKVCVCLFLVINYLSSFDIKILRIFVFPFLLSFLPI
jgi:hypothetical protein